MEVASFLQFLQVGWLVSRFTRSAEDGSREEIPENNARIWQCSSRPEVYLDPIHKLDEIGSYRLVGGMDVALDLHDRLMPADCEGKTK